MYKVLPSVLFTAIRAASRASLVSCWSSSHTRCAAAGNLETSSSSSLIYYASIPNILGI